MMHCIHAHAIMKRNNYIHITSCKANNLTESRQILSRLVSIQHVDSL